MNHVAKPVEFPAWTTPTARWFGMRVLSWDRETSTMRVSCEPPADVVNFRGVVQGGLLVAMMDEAMGFNTHVSLDMTMNQASIDIHTHFMRPVAHGRVEIEARVVHSGRSVAFVEAELYDGFGTLSARAVSSVRLTPVGGRQQEGNANG